MDLWTRPPAEPILSEEAPAPADSITRTRGDRIGASWKQAGRIGEPRASARGGWRNGGTPMRKLWQLGLAAAVAAILAAPVAGQGTTTGMTGGQGGQGGASQQLGNTNQQSIGGTSLATQQKAPTLTAPGTTSTSTNRAIDASNFLQQYYANPYYSGILTNAKNASFVPGGFGQTTFTTTGTGGTAGRGGQIGFAGGTGTGTTAGVVSPGGSSGGGFAARGGGVGGGACGVSVELHEPTLT